MAVFIIHHLEKKYPESDSNNTVSLCRYSCGVDFTILKEIILTIIAIVLGVDGLYEFIWSAFGMSP